MRHGTHYANDNHLHRPVVVRRNPLLLHLPRFLYYTEQLNNQQKAFLEVVDDALKNGPGLQRNVITLSIEILVKKYVTSKKCSVHTYFETNSSQRQKFKVISNLYLSFQIGL